MSDFTNKLAQSLELSHRIHQLVLAQRCLMQEYSEGEGYSATERNDLYRSASHLQGQLDAIVAQHGEVAQRITDSY